MYIANLGLPTDIGAVSGGADTVSKRNEYMILLIVFLDGFIRTNTILGDGTLS